MSSDVTLQKTFALVSKNFELPAVPDQVQEKANHLSLLQLKALLSKEIDRLLTHDFERLMQILYRIDVDEQRVRAILGGEGESTVANNLAALVVDRQLQKVENWDRFKQFM